VHTEHGRVKHISGHFRTNARTPTRSRASCLTASQRGARRPQRISIKARRIIKRTRRQKKKRTLVVSVCDITAVGLAGGEWTWAGWWREREERGWRRGVETGAEEQERMQDQC